MLKIIHLEHFVYKAFSESSISSQQELYYSSAILNFQNIFAVSSRSGHSVTIPFWCKWPSSNQTKLM